MDKNKPTFTGTERDPRETQTETVVLQVGEDKIYIVTL